MREKPNRYRGFHIKHEGNYLLLPSKSPDLNLTFLRETLGALSSIMRTYLLQTAAAYPHNKEEETLRSFIDSQSRTKDVLEVGSCVLSQ